MTVEHAPLPVPTPWWQYKFLRAEEHRRDIDTAIQWFHETGIFKAVTRFDTTTRRNSLVVVSVSEIPVQIPLAIGDCLGNYRASLDHMWTAILQRLGIARTGRTQFPIFNRAPTNHQERSRWNNQLARVPAKLEAIVAELQPFTRADPSRCYLNRLNDLVGYDKHRALSLMVARSGGPELSGPTGRLVMPPGQRLEAGSVLLELGDEEMASVGVENPSADLVIHTRVELAFVEPASVAGLELQATLLAISSEVAAAMQRLSRFYEPQPPFGPPPQI